MRKALFVASTLVVLGLAVTAPAQEFSPTEPPPPPPASAEIAGGPAGNVSSPFASPKAARNLTPRIVYAVVGRRLVTGVARPQAASAGPALVLRDEAEPGFVCVGSFRDAEYGGPDVRLDCSDGYKVRLSTVAYTEDSGFGRSKPGAATAASLTYGFRAKSAARRLVAPSGYVLVADGGTLSLRRWQG